MNISRLTQAMTDIDDELLSDAMEKTPSKSNRSYMKYLAAAACLVFAVTAGVVGIMYERNLPAVPQDGVTYAHPDTEDDMTVGGVHDIEPCSTVMTEEEVRNSEFGKLFLTIIPEGYKLNGNIRLYDDTVLEACYQKGVYSKTKSVIKIRMARKSWFETDGDPSPKDGGIYFEYGNIGAIYTMPDGNDYMSLSAAALSAACFTEREYTEIPLSFEPLEGESCDHKYYNVSHVSEPKRYEFEHGCTNGMICTATLEEYWHDMVCCTCGEVFGGYYRICNEFHSLTLDVPEYRPEDNTIFLGYCGTHYKGFCTWDEIGTGGEHESFQSRVNEWFTYGCPLDISKVLETIGG